jgi:hypothetical protein
MSFSDNLYAGPGSRTEANGRVTTFTYSTAAPHWSRATSGSRWTQSYVDGFGRVTKTETGHGQSTVVSVVDSVYGPCACSPLGKLVKQSLPHAPGGAVSWTEYVYDALGRTVEVRQPGGSGSTLTVYEGNTVKVTDPAGKWKKTETDAMGKLTRVWEPRPGSGADYETSYSYSVLGQLLTVTMTRPGYKVGDPATVTQTRNWVYDSSTQRLISVTHPESGRGVPKSGQSESITPCVSPEYGRSRHWIHCPH